MCRDEQLVSSPAGTLDLRDEDAEGFRFFFPETTREFTVSGILSGREKSGSVTFLDSSFRGRPRPRFFYQIESRAVDKLSKHVLYSSRETFLKLTALIIFLKIDMRTLPIRKKLMFMLKSY